MPQELTNQIMDEGIQPVSPVTTKRLKQRMNISVTIHAPIVQPIPLLMWSNER